MGKNLWEDETPGRENLKFVWKYYLLAGVGLGLVWLSQKVQAPLSSILVTVGALCLLTGTLLTLYWDRKRKKALEEKDEKEPASRK